MSSIFDYLKNTYQNMSTAFTKEWESTGWKKDPRGTLLYEQKETPSTEEKCKRLFLEQDYFPSCDDTSPPSQGYHGTSIKALGEEQLKDGKLENRNQRIYVDTTKTAKSYAEKKANIDGSTPIIMELASFNRLKTNNCFTDDPKDPDYGLGLYSYIPPGKDQEVYIKRIWEVRKAPPAPSSEDKKAIEEYNRRANANRLTRFKMSTEAAFKAVNSSSPSDSSSLD